MAARANVAVLGGAGGIGQPLSLLLKANARVGSVRVFDVAHAKGVAADLSHINTPAHVTGHVGDAELPAALKGADVIVIPAGVPRKPGMTRQDLFDTNAGIVKKLSEQIAQHAPKALICIITNPVNSTVAIAAETLKKAGVYDPRRLFGVTLLDITRARTFVSSKKGAEVTGFDVPVIGGHAGVTILPLLSRTSVPLNFTDAELDELTKRIQEGGTEVVNAKAGAGSATLSMAYAGHEFVDALVQGLQGKNPTVCAMVESTVVPGVKYFANPIVLGKHGLEKNLGIGKLSAYEQKRLDAEVIPELKASIAAGEKFVSK